VYFCQVKNVNENVLTYISNSLLFRWDDGLPVGTLSVDGCGKESGEG
jgi:hypothetical protein